MPHPILDGVSKNDLLKLKHSKPVPIIAHSSEVVVPVVYATRVKEFMKKEGMKVPLAPEELKTLKQVARKMDGTPEAYAKGGTIKGKKGKKAKAKVTSVIKKGNIKQIVNIKLGEKAKIIRRPSARAKAIGKDNIPIRPGVSTYPMGIEPSYSRMIPSTGAIMDAPKPLALQDRTVPQSQELVKSVAGPVKAPSYSLATQTNPSLLAIPGAPSSPAPLSIRQVRKRPIVAGSKESKMSKGPAIERAAMAMSDKK